MNPLPDAFRNTALAHRALHDDLRPENSLAAAEAALAAGYGMEVDLQPSSDGVAMVFHDATLARMTGRDEAVRDFTAVELSQIQLGESEAGIPTLSDLLNLAAGRVPLLLELKDQSGGQGGSDGVLEAGTLKALEGYDGPVALMSFNPAMVEVLAEMGSAWPLGLTTCDFRAQDWPDMPRRLAEHLARIPDYERMGAQFISHDRNDLGSARVAELKAAGAVIMCWTIRSAQEERAARSVAETITFEGYMAPMTAASD
ncbi:MAG: glycerophosphodiester phosphodiesterase family protein [Pseudomonadota bacterium]